MSPALSFFGPRSKLFTSLTLAVNRKRTEIGISNEELAESVAIFDAKRITELDSVGIKAFSQAEALTIISQLGIQISDVLTIDREKNEQFNAEFGEWEARRLESGAGPVYAAGAGADLYRDVATRLYVRLQAIKELFSEEAVAADTV